ncbi:iron chaperone [Arthrobacter sp.]|uniref:iron chaperone n=1 Tax=Arthrobacter sp. TaxID=1667 RepID=UPI003A8E2DEB
MGDVGTYLDTVQGQDRLALERVYAIARDVVPEAEEGTSYGMAALLYRGQGLIASVKAKKFLSVYPFSGKVIARHRDPLAGVETTAGSIHYSAEHPLPEDLLRAIVQARREEIDARAG